MKKFFIVLLSLIITSCSFKDNNSESIDNQRPSTEISSENINSESSDFDGERLSPDEEKNIKYKYPLDQSKNYKKDSSLYVNRMLFTYPSELVAKAGKPYTADDLKNLDYSKDVYYEYLNFRIPQRTSIFSNDKGLYAIDFPTNEDYGMRIYFKKLFENKKKKEADNKNFLYDTASDFMKKLEEKGEGKIIQKPYEIFDSQMDAYYSISQDKNVRHTYIFVDAPNSVVLFDIVEVSNESNASKYIMADLLSTMYIETEDPINVKKDFTSHTKDIDLYATDKADFGDFSLSLPKNMKNLQDDENFKAYANESKGDVLTYVLLIKSPKKDKKDNILNIDKTFNLTSGSNLAPAYIVGMGEVTNGKIKNKNTLSSEIRLYMDNLTSEGVKTCIETDEEYLTIIVTGPLANSNETKLLNKNILNTLDFKK